MNLELIFAALVAHYIGDYPLQGEFLATMKGKYDYLLFCHCFIWTGCVCAVLGYFHVFAWWKVAFLLIVHFMVDRAKARHPHRGQELEADLWVDQAIHFVQIIVVTTL